MRHLPVHFFSNCLFLQHNDDIAGIVRLECGEKIDNLIKTDARRSYINAVLADAAPLPAHSSPAPPQLTLHRAASKASVAGVLSELARLGPAAAAQADPEGRLALHVAAASKAPAELVAALLAVFPGGAAQPEAREGALPLTWAVAKGASPAVVGRQITG